jgi:hypothetical protein
LTSDDYRRALVPGLAAIHQQSGKVRVLFLMDETFEGWTLGAAWGASSDKKKTAAPLDLAAARYPRDDQAARHRLPDAAGRPVTTG